MNIAFFPVNTFFHYLKAFFFFLALFKTLLAVMLCSETFCPIFFLCKIQILPNLYAFWTTGGVTLGSV